jgi:regulation of enolase protein 1 (concanavalin A-like superfamily)
MTTKKIKLGIRNYDIPELAIRQRRVVVPLGMKLRETLLRLQKEKSIVSLTTQEMSDMHEVIYQGITRAAPKTEREAFLDFVFDEIDMISAYSIVVSQAGFEKRGDEMGEAKAGAVIPNSPQTGSNTSTT